MDRGRWLSKLKGAGMYLFLSVIYKITRSIIFMKYIVFKKFFCFFFEFNMTQNVSVLQNVSLTL